MDLSTTRTQQNVQQTHLNKSRLNRLCAILHACKLSSLALFAHLSGPEVAGIGARKPETHVP